MKHISNLISLLISSAWVACSQTATLLPASTSIPPTEASSSTSNPSTAEVTETIFIDAALSVDGSELAVYTNSGIYLYDTINLKKRVFQEFDYIDYQQGINGLRPGVILPGAIAFSPDGQEIAISGMKADTPVNITDLATGEVTKSIWDIQNGYYVTELQFSPNGKMLYIRSEYPRSMHCVQFGFNANDTSFAVHNIEMGGMGNTSQIYKKEDCINFSPYSKGHFIKDGNLFLYMERDMGPVFSYNVAINPDSRIVENEVSINEQSFLYDISSDGKYYAIFNPGEGENPGTTIVDAQTMSALAQIPYTVKLLDGMDRYMVQENIPAADEPKEWGLWENGKIVCHYDGLVYPSHQFVWDLSDSNEVFISRSNDQEITIWNVADCSIRNTLNFGP